MKAYSTNYYDTLITVAADSKAHRGAAPPARAGAKTVAALQFDLLINHPYAFTSDDLLFTVYADRLGLREDERQEARLRFFSKGQPCLRTSPLAKTYGWGIHADGQGKIKLVDSSSEEYQQLLNNSDISKVAAMKSRKTMEK
ncbi:hypothetical protein BC792_10498 [Sphingobacterium allocomposti]|uniref:Uncharacterized protein n=1 Tax=Sphingobacterium allocomposti TaxID=415956 RepID=A0A5S5DMJ5_9SPHI|nr:DUF6157 family protein [Sphingobacterium composti Yoo et al. 2007 non Ten et al. 2007]TYP96874.1 hypothetical protein BC792_10498 [Sphingobacterium composti Yoo et al. 2007 non Ten et al. 2007]